MRKILLRSFLVLEFGLFLVGELVLANFRLARDVVRPVRRLSPGIVAVPLDIRADAEIALLANLITLTPGTLSLDVSSDGRVLFVHAVAAGDAEALKSGIKTGFERRVRRLFA